MMNVESNWLMFLGVEPLDEGVRGFDVFFGVHVVSPLWGSRDRRDVDWCCNG